MIEHFKKFDGGGKKDLLPLSFSQLTEFAFHRERWALKRLYGYEFPSSPAMERGKAVESGLNMWLNGIDADDSIKKMQQEYDTNCNAFENAKIPEERENLVPLFNEGIDRLKDYAFKLNLIGYQEKVEMDIQGIPLVGYTDFHFIDTKTKEDFYIDLKTTLRKPNGISNSHAMQQAIYKKGLLETVAPENLDVQMLIATPKKYDVIKIDDISDYMKEIEMSLISMANLFKICKSKENFASIVTPNLGDWHWYDEDQINARKEIWGV